MAGRLFDKPDSIGTTPSGNSQRIYAFSNGWAASVVRGPYTYGGREGYWELAVLEGKNGPISYRSGITEDVIGWLTEDGVEDVLRKIRDLPGQP